MDCLHRTWVEIDIKALVENYDIIKKSTGYNICPVVKADAYGHGAVEVATALEKRGADCFAVSNILEAEELREAGVAAPILILGYTPTDCADQLSRSGFVQCVYSLDYATELSKSATEDNCVVNVHLKLDTGMCRIGFDCRTDSCSGLDEAKTVLKLSNLNVSGVFTHFTVADSDEQSDVKFTREQYERFLKAVDLLEADGHSFESKHICNSAATLNGIAQKGDTVRAGIILYGLAPSPSVPLIEGMAPVMSLYSVVSMVKEIEAGSSVSYGRTYTADKKRKIATVSAGYADGVPRLLSNKGSVVVHGKRAAIVGRVCMDQFCIDVTDIDDIRIGDKVTIFGKELSVDEVADWADTINYEIVCGINKRVEKIYIKKY